MRALLRPPPPPSLQPTHVPAPVGGLNTIAAGSAVPDGDCVQLFNLIPSEHGLRTRRGYRQHALFADSAGAAPITMMIPFRGGASDGSDDKLFAVNKYAIWDVTDSSNGAAITSTATTSIGATDGSPRFLGSTTGATTRIAAGYGSAHAYTTAAGTYLIYCDENTGAYIYDKTTSPMWQPILQGAPGNPGTINNVNPRNLCFVTSWKSRLWFVERDTNNVWYLPAGAIYGDATKLNVNQSAHFRNGGGVRALANWTLDGGIGIDDYLVAIGDGGDVAVYKGSDPASASTFSLNGTWNAGGLVAGRNVATTFGGDVLILTKSGIRPLSQLVAGQDGIGTYQTAKVANLFNALSLSRSELWGWAMHIHPEDNALLVLVPQYAGAATEQLAQSLWNRGWSRYRDLPINAACVWRGKLYFADASGSASGTSIWVNDGYVDGPTLAAPNTFSAVQFQVLTPFQNGDGRQKKVELIRPIFLADGPNVSFSAAARYNYDLRELSAVSLASPSGSGFDVGAWDSAAWSDDLLATRQLRSSTGLGTSVGVSIRGAARGKTVLVGADVFFKQGGLR